MANKILIVDDDIDTLQLVGTMLERQGFQILAANNGLKAIELAQKDKPDLILLDVMMPGMDGYEVTRRLRTMENTAFIPIIMFTAKAQVDDKVEGFEAGADDYLTKPTHPAELIARVKKILTRPKTGALTIEDTSPTLATGQLIGVLASKGGLGVSTLALNLGVSIHQQTDQYVTVAELRPGQGDIGIYLGYAQPDGLSNLLRKPAAEIRLEDVESELITHGSGIQLLLSSSRPTDIDLMQATDQIEAITRHLISLSPYTVVDMGVGLPTANQRIAKLCDTIVVIVEPSRHSITQTNLLLSSLEDLGVSKDKVKVVLINRQRLEITIPANQLAQQIGIQLAGVLTPAPELFYQAATRHQPAVNHQPNSLVVNQINKLADSIATQDKEQTAQRA